jgi:hypothetical protein
MPTMKRLGKPDTGNPFVRFDEGRSGSAELTTAVRSIRLLPLRLLYLSPGAADKILHQADRESESLRLAC